MPSEIKPRKLELKIEVKNFGPISFGEITLKPLTLFIGPNNSGKSYAAMLIHSIFESYIPIFLRRHYIFGEFNRGRIIKDFRAIYTRNIL